MYGETSRTLVILRMLLDTIDWSPCSPSKSETWSKTKNWPCPPGFLGPLLKNISFLLENTYVLKLVLPFFTNKRTEIVKTPKVYFEDIGLRNRVLNNFSPLNQRTDSGAILENFVFSQLCKHNEQSDDIRFWRSQTKSEVDFIWQKNSNAPCPIDVKFNYVQKQPLTPGLRNFISIYHPARAFIIHLGGFHFRKFKDTNLYAIPAWVI